MGIFGVEFENNIAIFEFRTLDLPYCKLCCENENEYFWAGIFKKLFLYLKPTPSDLSNCKVLCKIKNS